jgi:hypothetical protein
MLRYLTSRVPKTAEFPGFPQSVAAEDSRILCVRKYQHSRALRREIAK